MYRQINGHHTVTFTRCIKYFLIDTRFRPRLCTTWQSVSVTRIYSKLRLRCNVYSQIDSHYTIATNCIGDGVKPTSMIDISDGLASEVFHICRQSKVGAVIEEAKVPLHTMTEELAVKFRMDPITCALNGGEDYELLFTLDPEDIDKLQFLDDVYLIGTILPEKDGIMLETSGGNFHRLKAQGWQHFD